MPSLVNGRSETSVFRVVGLDDNELRGLGREIRPDRTLKGIANIQADIVYGADLQFDPDNTPERHANIIGWPNDKADQKELAQELANKATLIKV